ncbi:hypothetical protein HEQ60_10355 [Haematospirillum sp. H1815]|uniref:hypothetical protein n=1 Tax=Haematospirillum sp. H1815 TaxID=2723108 RepID=UPI00143A7998|nr:hypothetical protein [Haematospirillum sp. H1815]NKD78158.1 hypothetical protein [Haematospirillum sp. H1815]
MISTDTENLQIRTVTWTPKPGALFTLPETSAHLSRSITCTVRDPAFRGLAVTGYHASLEPKLATLSINCTAGAVHVTADRLHGSFDGMRLTYRQGNALIQAHSWDDLPASGIDLVTFHPSRTRRYDGRLVVTASLSDGTTEQATYTLCIFQDWTAGSLRLREEIHARCYPQE